MSLKYNANVASLGMPKRIAVVAYVTLLHGEDGMVAAHVTVFAGEPFGAALPVDDDAWDDKFSCDIFLVSLLSTGRVTRQELMR